MSAPKRLRLAVSSISFLKYAPVTTFVFDRERSISLEGETGAYCQYAYARATSMLKKLNGADDGIIPDYQVLEHEQAQAVLKAILAFSE